MAAYSDNKEAFFSVRNLTTIFPLGEGKKLIAVDNVSFDLYRGEMLGIVGESGSGKSLTLKSILKLVPKPGIIEGGQIFLDGCDISGYSNSEMRHKVRGEQISMIFQEPMTALNPTFSVENQINEVYKLHPSLGFKTKEQRYNRTIDILRKVKISDPSKRMKEYPHQFSGGMRQRVLISIALACNPKILFADEPTTALDVTVQADIMDLLGDMKREENLSIILVSHNLNLVTERSDRIIVFYAGNIMEMSTSTELVNSPLHPYTSGLMASLPDIENENKRIVAIPGELPDLSRKINGCAFHLRCHDAMSICEKVKPDLREVKPGHFCRCHLYDKNVFPGTGGEF